eukprot:s6688_g7.t1
MCSKRFAALIRSLAGTCFLSSASDKILAWTPWINHLSREVQRSLQGAFRLHHPRNTRPVGLSVSEVLGCCFLPMCMVLGGWGFAVYLTGMFVILQVHEHGRLPHSTSLCPRSVYMSPQLCRCLLCILTSLHPAAQRDYACIRAQEQCSCGGVEGRGLDMSSGSSSANVAPMTPNGTPLPAGPPPPRPVNEPQAVGALREASQRVASKLADALHTEGVYVNRIKVELPARYLDITRWNVQMDHLGERAAWQEHANTIFMDSESDGEDAAEMPVFEATVGSEGGSEWTGETVERTGQASSEAHGSSTSRAPSTPKAKARRGRVPTGPHQ